MKVKLLFIASLVGLSASSFAQTPKKESKGLVLKFTETWCGPCGSWGWNMANEILSQLGTKGYYIGVMGSSQPTAMNANCYTTFEPNYPVSGYPTFITNDVDGGMSSGDVINKINTYAATATVASPAAFMAINGSTLNVTAKAKFWSAANGEYYLSAFVVEDGVMATQNGQTGSVAHHHLMRGTMDAAMSPWGQQIATGAIAANAEFTKTFSMPIPAEWVKAKLEVYTVIYKKNGNKYEFVNVDKATTNSSTSIAEVSGVDRFVVYPNPANGATYIDISLQEAMQLNVAVTDLLGRNVYTANNLKLNAGKNNIALPSEKFANGIYNVSIIDKDGKAHNTRLVITK